VQKSPPCQGWNIQDRLHSAQLHDKDNPYNTYEHEACRRPDLESGKALDRGGARARWLGLLYFVAKDARNHVSRRRSKNTITTSTSTRSDAFRAESLALQIGSGRASTDHERRGQQPGQAATTMSTSL